MDSALLEKYAALPGKDVWINEADFGYTHIHPYLKALTPGAKVLEVGAGFGILLTAIQKDFPHLKITGLEPFRDGFLFPETYRKIAQNPDIQEYGYEDFKVPDTFDLIFLINVFEHLPDWFDFLKFVKAHLSENGVCVILCPNYGFPYESHFRLPIIINKDITYKIFKNRIQKFEKENNRQGLWKSLNFVKWSALRKACAKLGLQYKFDPNIMGP